MRKQSAVRDYIEGERSIQTFLRVYLSFSNYYITRTEAEMNLGFCDIALLPHFIRYPDMKYSYLLEIKYIGVSEYSESKLESKIKDAREKLGKYSADENFSKLIGATELKKIILVFCGIELKYKESEKGPLYYSTISNSC